MFCSGLSISLLVNLYTTHGYNGLIYNNKHKAAAEHQLGLLTGSSTTLPPCSAASFTSRRARLRLSALTADTCSWTTARRNSGGARREEPGDYLSTANVMLKHYAAGLVIKALLIARCSSYLLDMALAKVDIDVAESCCTSKSESTIGSRDVEWADTQLSK